MTNIHLLYNNADPVKDGYDSDDGTVVPPPSPAHSAATAVGGASELTMCLLCLPPPPSPRARDAAWSARAAAVRGAERAPQL